MAKDNYIATECVDLSVPDGVAFIAQASPLTRLHYFDGQYLRADSMALEQDYLRERNRLGNLAGGWGVVNGLGVSLSGANLQVSAGLAITPAGQPVLAVVTLSAALTDLLKLATVATVAPATGNSEFADCLNGQPMSTALPATLSYEITVGPIESLCGNEAVYGKLCASACACDSQHPWWREGVALRLRPIHLTLPDSSAVTLGLVHLRNRAACAYFAAEPWLTAAALSSAGLASSLWCNPASLYGRDEVPLGLLLIEGSSVRVLDAWSARRERMDTQAHGYWQGRMAMRPWNVFLAQILQFQCQLTGLFNGSSGTIQPADDCGQLRQLLDQTRKDLEAMHQKYSDGAQTILKQFSAKPSKQEAQVIADEVKIAYAQLYEISGNLAKAELGKGVLPKNRLLLNAGFVQLPPAGYLPVVPGKQSLEDQLSRMFGEGVQLSYHAVRHDEIAHLLEEAQHMERISLTRGLDDPKQLEAVEIFVPDGQVISQQAAAPGTWWQVEMSFAAMKAFQFGLAADSKNLQAVRDMVGAQIMKERAATVTPDAAASEVKMLYVQPALDEATRKELLQKISQLLDTIQQRNLYGLARTESRDDASYGFTLVCKPDIDDLLTEARAILDKYPELDPNGNMQGKLDLIANLAWYMAGDIAADPFDLDFGAETSLKGEIRLGSEASPVSGTLTALLDRTTTGGQTERVVMLRLIVTSADGSLSQNSGRLSLLRKGDANNGQLVLDDARHDPATSPNYIDWSDAPRTATMSVLADTSKLDVAVRYMMKMAAPADTVEMAATTANDATAIVRASARQQVLKMTGLNGMPALTSPLGAAAMNALIGLADTSNDAAFLARASRRLFPTLATPATTSVRAVLDWVMFRRARTHLCCPTQPAAVSTGLEAFQVWHLQVANRDVLKVLQTALDNNDTQGLAEYAFKRVGVLRYRDENSVSEEPDYQVLSMWRQAQPGSQVLLGRYWEQAPASGQGWQNHFRLTNMLDQISSLTQPPPAGSGAIAALTTVSPPLSNGALDGGMLVVTLAAAVQLKPQRVLLVPYYNFHDDLLPVFKMNPDDGWQRLTEIAKKYPDQIIDLSLQYVANTQMEAASLTKLKEGDTKMSLGAQYDFYVTTLRIDASPIDSNSDPAARHQEVTDNVGTSGTLIGKKDDGIFKVSFTDLGGGAQTASVVFYQYSPG
jgi:hypothetical protein